MLEHRPRDAYGLLAAMALLLVACQSGSPPRPDASEAPAPAVSPNPSALPVEPREPNTLAGVYTDAQAQRGRQVFENICSTCHNTEEWQDELFLARWEGESVYRFWFFIYERMPGDAPPYALPREQVSDVLTYILQLNGLPSGDTELGSDDDSIDPYWLHWGSLGF